MMQFLFLLGRRFGPDPPLYTLLMCNKGFMELGDDTHKIKQTQERKLVEEILVELSSQSAPFSESETLVIPKTQKFPESFFYEKA